jgi:xylan 1,4-beta-xylosidase
MSAARIAAMALALAVFVSLTSSNPFLNEAGVALAPTQAPTPALTYRNPVLAADYPDPSVVRIGREYWATATSSAHAPGFPLVRSTDLVHWQAAGSIFPGPPAWASDSLWAPEIVTGPAGGTLVYYTARRTGGPLCVAVASAPAPAGPYTDHGPLVCQPLGSIDATRVIDERGVPYLVWKEDGNSAQRPTVLWAQRLRRSGLGLIGPRRQLLRDEDSWEGGLIEAPEFVRHDGWLYLFFSGNTCCTPPCRYAVGVARSRSLFGDWQRDPRNPIIRGNRAWKCPGHGSVVADAEGRDFFLYHAFPARDTTYAVRYGLLDAIRWGPNGWPTVNGGRGPSVTDVIR